MLSFQLDVGFQTFANQHVLFLFTFYTASHFWGKCGCTFTDYSMSTSSLCELHYKVPIVLLTDLVLESITLSSITWLFSSYKLMNNHKNAFFGADVHLVLKQFSSLERLLLFQCVCSNNEFMFDIQTMIFNDLLQ